MTLLEEFAEDVGVGKCFALLGDWVGVYAKRDVLGFGSKGGLLVNAQFGILQASHASS